MEFKKYKGVGEVIFVARDKDKWVQWCETYRSYRALRDTFDYYDEQIKELLFNKLQLIKNICNDN